MTVTAEDLAAYVNASPEDAALAVVLAEAEVLITEHLGTGGVVACPTAIRDLAVKQLGSELWSRRNAPGGVVGQWPDGSPVRLARDPMVSVKPLLLPYRSLGVVG